MILASLVSWVLPGNVGFTCVPPHIGISRPSSRYMNLYCSPWLSQSCIFYDFKAITTFSEIFMLLFVMHWDFNYFTSFILVFAQISFPLSEHTCTVLRRKWSSVCYEEMQWPRQSAKERLCWVLLFRKVRDHDDHGGKPGNRQAGLALEL